MKASRVKRTVVTTLLLTPFMLLSNPVYVNKFAGGSNNGTSWADAYVELETAINNSSAGAEIWVAAATYLPSQVNDRTASFTLKPGMKLYGGFTSGMSTLEERDWEANKTILSGNLSGAGNRVNNSQHIVVGAAGAVVDGFTIEFGGDNIYDAGTDGALPAVMGGAGLLAMDLGADGIRLANLEFHANEMYWDGDNEAEGAGVYAKDSALEIINCRFVANRASRRGGAVSINNSGAALEYPVRISGSYFRGNYLRANGGNNGGAGIWVLSGNFQVNDSEFIGNDCSINDITESRAGAIFLRATGSSNFYLIENSIFVGNRSGMGHAGAIFAQQNVTIDNCIFARNFTETRSVGGALYVAADVTANVSRSVFAGNYVPQNVAFPDGFWFGIIGGSFEQGRGAGIASYGKTHAINCIFTGNFAAGTERGGSQGGGAAFWQGAGSAGGSILENCTIVGNRSNKYGAVSARDANHDVTLVNTICWDNEAWRETPSESDTFDELYGDKFIVNYSNIKGGWIGPGGNNLDIDPLFASALSGFGPNCTGTWTVKPTYDGNTGLTTLTDENADWDEGEHVGRFLEPRTTPVEYTKNDYTNMLGGLKFPVHSNTKTVIKIYGDVTQVSFWRIYDNVYAAEGESYRIYDYHLKAHGQRWVPLTAVTGRWVRDDVHSPCIDAGDPTSPYGLEPDPNGKRINIGAYGNTAQASSTLGGTFLIVH